MALYWTFENHGVVDSDHWVDAIPSDAVEITLEERDALVNGANSGRVVVRDANGRPALSDPPPAPPVIPQRVTKFQAKAALFLAGLLDDVEALMADPATDRITRLAWTESLHFERQSPMIAAMASLLGLSNQQLDALFVSAFAIE